MALVPAGSCGRACAWALYFPGEPGPEEGDRRAALVDEISAALASSSAAARGIVARARASSAAQNCFDVSYAAIFDASAKSADLQAALEFQPLDGLRCVGAALCRAVYFGVGSPQEKPTIPLRVRLREYVHTPVAGIAELRANCVGKLVSVRGTVVRASAVRPLVTMLDFRCERCGERQAVAMPDGVYQPPKGCGVNGCKSWKMQPVRKAARLVDWQRVRLQEQTSFGDSSGGGGGGEQQQGRGGSSDRLCEALDGEGRVPRSVEVDLREDLAGKVAPGDEVTVVGIVKAVDADEAARNGISGGGFGGGRQRSTVYLIFLEAISLVSCPRRGGLGQAEQGNEADGGDTTAAPVAIEAPPGAAPHSAAAGVPPVPGKAPTFSKRELAMVAYVARQVNDPLRLLVHSLCPDIYGSEMAKCGLVLSLLGGVRLFDGGAGALSGKGGGQKRSSRRRSSGGGTRVPVRGDIHCLLLGDPGLGKSQLLRAVTAASPRGVYVGGGHASAAGLTAAVARDGQSGMMFEAGALVMADGGTCCVDELDKLGTSYGNLLEAMEQQSVSLAKAGLVSTLQARTTVVAAANPTKGHYDRTRTVAENIKMPAPLLSRFDLIFVLLDRSDTRRDEVLTRHVMDMHGGRKRKASLLLEVAPGEEAPQRCSGGLLDALEGGAAEEVAMAEGGGGGMGLGSGGGALAARLRARSPSDPDPLPPPLLRTYIAYARQHCHPELDAGACATLKAFYLKLRQQAAGKGAAGAPITARQLESLARLTQARARADLRSVATAADAADAINVMRASLRDVLEDEAGMIDLRRAGGMSKQAEAKRLMAELQRKARAEDRAMLTLDEIRAAGRALHMSDVDGAVESLNAAGVLLKKGHRIFALAASLAGRGSGVM